MDYIPVGTIVNTHGLRGTLKVKSSTDFKSIRYQKGNVLYIDFRHTMIPVTVQSYRTVKGMDYIDFKEFTDINQCEQYKGSNLCMHSDQKHELDDDEYYFDELIGLEVYTTELIGTCIDVRDVPQGQLLVVETNEKQVLIPFTKEFIQKVDVKTKRITIIEWEGLL